MPNHCKSAEVVRSDQRIHDAVAECVQQASEEKGKAANFIYQYAQWLIKEGWKPEDAQLVGSRAVGVLNAMNAPPSPGVWG